MIPICQNPAARPVKEAATQDEARNSRKSVTEAGEQLPKAASNDSKMFSDREIAEGITTGP